MSAVRKLKPRPQPSIFHATMLVTRAEEWWVEAESAEEARALFASGHHAALGERVHVELEELLDEMGNRTLPMGRRFSFVQAQLFDPPRTKARSSPRTAGYFDGACIL